MNNGPTSIIIVGYGKIAKDQHLPALAGNPEFELVAMVTRSHEPPPGIRVFRHLDDLLASGLPVQALSLCTPPQSRYALARQALEHGLHLMLEKPPGATVREVEDLAARARRMGLSLFATWHSREAPAVAAAREWLANRPIRKVAVNWKENVRKWHPGQSWLWQPGGLGVFDPGINALSLVTAIHPRSVFIREAVLHFPSNRDAPIAASLTLSDANDLPINAEFDFRQLGSEVWDIVVETDEETLCLGNGGATLQVNRRTVATAASAEYPRLYRRFAEMIRTCTVDADVLPLQLVADAFLIGRRQTVDPFYD